MPEEPSIWEIRLGIYATPQQAEEVKERISRMLCPDPDHAPPCPVPWSILMLHQSDLDDPDSYAHVVEQGLAERS
ncbi:hypothetical protein HC031_20055 [Planosporangium thailandense]|uniref:SPOR domain-containing protein n=1 Tax=Planosporangium thailandense TaxID=765197 RepID=A0ABX0Y1H3_9ACTN|nr:hypothetical protein [Planosporangium thailandense]NJC71992.1 hypothetical protein [Planosporangium thailandense]